MAALGVDAVPFHKADDIGQLVTNTASHLVVRNATTLVALICESLKFPPDEFFNLKWR
jgi:hypothetical protein